MRAQSKNPWEPMIQEAVSRADANRRRDTPTGTSRAPVTSATVEGDDGSTLHPFMLGVDALGAGDAFLVVRGVSYNYLS